MAREELARLIRDLKPGQTSLLLGAGAAYSSGAPLAVDLCRQLEADLAAGEKISDDLTEVAGILELRTSRKAMVESIARRLSPLEPDGALIALSAYPWRSIFTTNFDRLVERAYQRAGAKLSIVRSHFDWEEAHAPGVTPLFKMHGCITQDRALGHRASMIVTPGDYAEFDQYRQLLFDRLKMEIAGSQGWIIGYSLRDPHVQRLVEDALRLQREAAAPGRLNLLMYEYDADRAKLWLSRGVRAVVQGDLNGFVHELAANEKRAPTATRDADSVRLPLELAPCTVDVERATQPSNAKRLFYGGAATFADIRAGLTFERDIEQELREPKGLSTVITGVAGTGKTTLARRLLIQSLADGWAPYEHRADFPLDTDTWIGFERALAGSGRKAMLLVDNCPSFQRQVNSLIRKLPLDSALHLVVTAETSAWRPRQKDARFFSHARSISLSELSKAEISELCSLVLKSDPLRTLVQPELLTLTRPEIEQRLRRKCSADMFVCLKALFSSDSLDDIILREYAGINEAFQGVYRVTAALEAAGALPHRQMVLRTTGLSVSLIGAALEVLEGLVDEVEPESDTSHAGIYLWRTRHEVIARIISRYKYSDPVELKELLERVISTANPSYFEETKTLREMCNAELGIRALPDPSDRIALYRKITETIPADRVARHRLVRELIQSDRLGDAEAELKRAIDDVSLDPPLQRYRVLIHLRRSRSRGLRTEDRRAILQLARSEVEFGIERFPDSKYMYYAAADVAEEWLDVTNDPGLVTWAKHLLDRGFNKLLDPDLTDRAAQLERIAG